MLASTKMDLKKFIPQEKRYKMTVLRKISHKTSVSHADFLLNYKSVVLSTKTFANSVRFK